MDRRLALLMAKEAQNQAKYAFEAVKEIDKYLGEIDSANEFKERNKANDMFWYSMQMFLTSTANVSKILWGVKKTPLKERSKIRDFLNTENNSALKSTRLRNKFEHYDEKLIDWHKYSKNKNIVQNAIGPDNLINGIDPSEIMKHYNPQEGKMIFRGQIFHLKPVVRELKRIIKIELPDW